MRTILFNVPDTIELNERDAKMIVAAKLFEKGKISLGQASDLVGLSKQTFMELLADYDVILINYSSEELVNDVKNAKNYCV